VFLVQCSRSTSYITQRCNACNWLKCAASTGVGIAGVGITGVGIAGVGIAVCSPSQYRKTSEAAGFYQYRTRESPGFRSFTVL